jgi:phage gpG-like protein
MPSLDLKFEWQSLTKGLSKIKARSAAGMYQALQKALIFLEARIKESVRAKLNRNPTGRLSSSWTHNISFSGSKGNMDMEGRVGTNVKYATTHEFGDPNRHASNVGALTIPFPGTAGRYPPARELWARGDTFMKRTKWGASGIIFIKQRGLKNIGYKTKVPKGMTGIPIYILTKKVSIPKRSYIKPVLATYNKQLMDLLGKGWKASIEEK